MEFLKPIIGRDFLLQVAAVFLGLLISWALSRLASRSRWPVTRLVFPVSWFLFILLAREALSHLHRPVAAIELAIPAVLALSAIRIIVYMMRSISSGDKWLTAWEKIVTWAIWILLLLKVSGLLHGLFLALDDLSFNFGKARISALTILQAAVAVAASFLIALWASLSIEKRIMGAEIMDMNLRVMLSKLTRTLLLVVAFLAALSAAGIDMTVLSLFGGALGVGLGLGLQKIASNYLSGFIILLDRSIHIDDIISVDDRMGVLTKLTTRHVVLKSTDGSEALIPNDTLITSTVINHTYSDRQVNLSVPIQVGYSTDLDFAMKIMKDAAAHQPRVLKDPEPKVYLRSFADSGIDLSLSFWIADLEEGRLGLISDINLEIWREFGKHGIEIPFPQREVRILGKES